MTLRDSVSHDVRGLDGTIYGMMLMLFIIYMPKGILVQLLELAARRYGAAPARPPATGQGAEQVCRFSATLTPQHALARRLGPGRSRPANAMLRGFLDQLGAYARQHVAGDVPAHIAAAAIDVSTEAAVAALESPPSCRGFQSVCWLAI
jgi:hypothetical protein